MQMKNEAWGKVGNDLFEFVQGLPVSGPDGKQRPRALETLLESDVLALVVNFTQADQKVSEKRTLVAFVFCKFVQNDIDAICCALIDKGSITEGQGNFRKWKPQIDEDLVKLKSDIEKRWNTARLAEPATIALLQSHDQAFGTKYATRPGICCYV